MIFKASLKSEFARNAYTLTLGTSIAQAFPLLFYPILGRIFTPAEFGLLATLTSITSILAVTATGKYESSILITKTKKDAVNIVGLVLILSVSFLLISCLILFVLSNQLNHWLNEPNLKKWLFVCPISAFAIIIFNCYNEWCVRNKYFIVLSWNKIKNSAAITLSKLFFGFIKISSSGLVIGDLIGRVFSAGGCIFSALRKDKSDFIQMSHKRMRVLAKRYIEFPKFIFPGQLLNTIGGQLPVLIIGSFFNSREVGYFSMTMSVLSVPISVISNAIRDVFRQRANEEYQKRGNCVHIFVRIIKKLAIWTALGCLILYFTLPTIFSLVLGDQWRTAGEYSKILCPMIALSFICDSLSGIFIITNKMKIALFWQMYYVGITILSLFVGYAFIQNIRATIICFAIGRCSAYLLDIYLSYRYSKGTLILKK